MKSILKDWVQDLGLRHQGVLVAAVCGCDTAPKNDPSKLLARCFREVILNPHCGDAVKAATFIQKVTAEELLGRFNAFRGNLDHYPHHYIMHMLHAIEILAYKHPDASTRAYWNAFYLSLCVGLHTNSEGVEQLDARLNADEATFAARNQH